MRGMGQYSAVALLLFITLSLPYNSRAVDFAPGAPYPVGTSPSAIVVGDFNGDGKSDLAVANFGGSNVSVLVNKGDGTFLAAVTSSAGTAPQAMVAGDFNGDSKLDLVLINQGNPPSGAGGAVSLLSGNNDGTFQAPVQIEANQFPASVAVADLNADGKPDLILGDAARGTLTILLGKGDGTFQKPATMTLASSGSVAALAVGDFNADKKVDIVAAISSGPVFILLGNGDGSFRAPAQIATDTTSPHLLVGDFNGDGKLDLVLREETPRPPNCRRAPCFGLDRIFIFNGNSDGTFNAGTSTLLQINASTGNLATGDFNADGKPDLIEPRFESGLLFLGRNNGTFLAVPPLWTGLGAFLGAADLNGDNLSDLAVTDTNNNVVVFLNTSPTSGADLSVTEPATQNVVVGGDDLGYRATVLNTGPQDATGVTLKETLPAGFTLVSTQPSQGTCSGTTTITCNLGAMADASSATVDFTVTPTAAGIFTDGLHITATEPDLNSKNNSASMTITAVLPADLTVSGTASETTAKIGDQVTFNITVTNHGPATATNVVLTDSLSDALPVSSLTISQGSCPSPITCSIGTLAPAASATLSFAVTMATAEFFANNLSVGSDQPDLLGDNNNAILTIVVNPADLAVTQTASAVSVVTGTQVTITLNLVNKGPATANNVVLTDLQPVGGTLGSATASQGLCSPPSGGQITCGLGSLAPSATATVIISVTFTDVGQWTDSASLSATEPDPDSSNNQTNLNIDVAQAPDFVVTPASPSLTMQPGASGMDVLTVASLGGFAGTVSLACSVAGPVPAPSCSVSPSSVTPGSNPVTATLTLTALRAGLEPAHRPGLEGLFCAALLPLPGIAFIGIGLTSSKSRKRRTLVWLLWGLAIVVIALQAACGGGSTAPPPQPRIYTVTVTASSGSISKSTQIQLTVQ
ncbi:MAG: FG-GAP-like repeat-containing protein [Terriglobales bacterium]